ncbi:tetratricopeptide repeat protein [Aquimarina sp. MAR_2010_214]|uniref:tetratricopeptide repeat-containing sensor histidine kinase n=1 Tax=Aquimarina sp. MAR_2010_214 TaxID=1250026 RepID=UPI000C70FBD5|nr:ATP-binding protein [Aquimarina sp. MAR_2010_214]PKV52168.1 tetratricopeptide repeat protein [Aquimarina sp. MAR_2010_214]
MTIQKALYLLILLLINVATQAQTEKDYCAEWKSIKDTTSNGDLLLNLNKFYFSKVAPSCKVEILRENSTVYKRKLNIDSAFYYVDQAIILGKEINDYEQIGDLYSDKGGLYIVDNQLVKAKLLLKKSRDALKKYPESMYWVGYYNQMQNLSSAEYKKELAITYSDSALQVAIRFDITSNIPNLHQNIGVQYYHIKEYELAVENFLKALELKEEYGSQDIVNTYYVLGVSYNTLKQYETALYYINIGIERCKKDNNDRILLLNYIILSRQQRNLKSYEKALENIDLALVLAKKLKSDFQIGECLRDKGLIYYEGFEDYKLAEQYFNQAYTISKIIQIDRSLKESLLAMLRINFNKKDYKKVKGFLEELEELVLDTKLPGDTQDWHDNSKRYFESTGNFEKALFHYTQYNRIKDSLSNSDVKFKVANLEKKYNTKKKELTIINLNREKEEKEQIAEKEKTKQNLYLLASVFLLLILIIGVLSYRKLRKQQKELTATNRVKNRLFSIIAHDLRGMIIPFQRSGKILKHHIDKGNHERTIELSNELEKNSESLSNMLDNLLNWSLEQMKGYRIHPERLSVKEQFDEIIKGFEQQATYKNTNIKLKYHKDVSIKFDKGAFHVIFRNLIGNALKYTENGNIEIEFKRDFNTLVCSVSDTGVGMTEEQLQYVFTLKEGQTSIGTQGEKGTGLGLNLVYRFVNMHKGVIKVSSKRRIGTRFDLSFPIANAIELEQEKAIESRTA